jgi:hypothetical protein
MDDGPRLVILCGNTKYYCINVHSTEHRSNPKKTECTLTDAQTTANEPYNHMRIGEVSVLLWALCPLPCHHILGHKLLSLKKKLILI